MDGERFTEVPDVRRCECCGKPYDRDDDCVAVDSRDLLNWLSALWWRDPRLSGLVFSRLMLPRAPLQQLAPMIGASKATTTRLWKRLESAAPAVAAWLRGAERRGGKRNPRADRTRHLVPGTVEPVVGSLNREET